LAVWHTGRVYKGLGIVSAALFCAFSILYLLRFYKYPQKVLKEFNHPVAGNMFSAITICVTLYGLMMFDHDLNFGIALVWIGSAAQMAMTMLKISQLVFKKVTTDLLNAGVMMAPVSNFICALSFASYQMRPDVRNYDGAMNYQLISRFWFAVAALFAVALFVLTLGKSLNDHHSDARIRPTLWIWMATVAVAGPAYFAVSADSSCVVSTFAIGKSVFYQSFFLLGLFFFAINCFGWLMGFFSYVPDMSIWMYAFSCCALSLSCVYYYYFVGDQFTMILVIISIVISCFSTAVCCVQSLGWAFDGSLFKPKPKWGPVNFMKFFHEAFRFSLPSTLKWLDALDANSHPAAIADFLKWFNAISTAYLNHGNHEERVLFPAVRRFFPDLNLHAEEEHTWEHDQLHKFTNAIAKYQEDPSDSDSCSAMLTLLKAELPAWSDHLLTHLRNEEASISVVARKYFSLELQKQLTETCFALTPAKDWELIFPFLLKSLPTPNWKIQIIRCFIWANPERAQEIGLMLYRKIDSVLFEFVANEIPEIVPRGLSKWNRNY